MATITAASNSYADVAAAVATSNDTRNNTVIIPYATPNNHPNWSGHTLVLQKGIILTTTAGKGRDDITITNTGKCIQIDPDAQATDDEEIICIKNLTIDGGNSALTFIEINGAAEDDPKPFKNFVVGDCRFKNGSATDSGNHCISPNGQVRGVVYGNIFDRIDFVIRVEGNNEIVEWTNGNFPFAFGNADNLFFEDNTIQFSTDFASNASTAGGTECGQGGRLCMRYNHWDFDNLSEMSELWDIHGFQNFDRCCPPGQGNGQTSTMISEYYGNTIVNFFGYRALIHRGSRALIFNNSFAYTGGFPGLGIGQYDFPADGGSGCDVDTGVPGGQVNTTYCWNNLNANNGTIIPMDETGVGFGCGTTEDVHFWNYNSNFNGSTGMGRGTGTPSGGTGEGVAYWQCGTPGPTVNPSIVQSGKLWKRTGGTWSMYYTPYTYPHPLRNLLSIGGQVTYGVNSYPVPGVTLTVSGDSSTTTTTDANGNYLIYGLAAGGDYVVTPSKANLAAGAHGIDTNDAIAIQKHILGYPPFLQGWARTAADVDLNGLVRTADALAVSAFYQVRGSGYSFTGAHKFSPTSTTYTDLATSQTGQNYTCYVLGDVAPPYVYASPPGGAPQGFVNSSTVPPAVTDDFKEVPQDYVAPEYIPWVQEDALVPADGEYDNTVKIEQNLSYPTTPPYVSSGIVQEDGQTVLLYFTKPILGGEEGGEWFTVSVDGGDDVIASYLAGNGGKEFTLYIIGIEDAVGVGQTVELTYQQKVLHDYDGNSLGDFDAMVIDNNSTVDITVPLMISATVGTDGDSLTLVFDSEVTGDFDTGFDIVTDGNAVSATYVSGDETDTIVFSLDATVGSEDTLTLSYVPGDIADVSANALALFADEEITNNSTQDTYAPTLTSATVGASGDGLTLVFNEAVTGTLAGGLAITTDGDATTATYASGTGTATIVYTLSATVLDGDVLTLDYTPGNIADTSANLLEAIADHAVVNNSEAT